jgi:type II secretory ATPase GspE/PulE/Tfp pilus assembly ATPase PilB-like protein
MEPAEQGESKEAKDTVKLLNASEAAFELGITRADVARLREQGKLPGVRRRWGRWFYHPDALAAVITDAPSDNTSPEQPPTAGPSLASIINEIGPGPRDGDDDVEDDKAARGQAPIVRMANAILVQAIDSGASDIHVETDSRNTRIQCRIDGILHEIMKIPNHIKGPLIQRYKIMADINILQRYVPQAGTVRLKHCGNDYDMRVSTLPSR